MQLIELILLAMKVWSVVGFLFGVVFVIWGVQQVDGAAVGSGWGFRLLILPGCLIFWPWLALLWMRGRSLPVESSAHRRAVLEKES